MLLPEIFTHLSLSLSLLLSHASSSANTFSNWTLHSGSRAHSHTFSLSCTLTLQHRRSLSFSLVADKDEAASRRRSPPIAAAGSARPAQTGSQWRRGGSTIWQTQEKESHATEKKRKNFLGLKLLTKFFFQAPRESKESQHWDIVLNIERNKQDRLNDQISRHRHPSGRMLQKSWCLSSCQWCCLHLTFSTDTFTPSDAQIKLIIGETVRHWTCYLMYARQESDG